MCFPYSPQNKTKPPTHPPPQTPNKYKPRSTQGSVAAKPHPHTSQYYDSSKPKILFLYLLLIESCSFLMKDVLWSGSWSLSVHHLYNSSTFTWSLHWTYANLILHGNITWSISHKRSWIIRFGSVKLDEIRSERHGAQCIFSFGVHHSKVMSSRLGKASPIQKDIRPNVYFCWKHHRTVQTCTHMSLWCFSTPDSHCIPARF